jgi:hypothetical protein
MVAYILLSGLSFCYKVVVLRDGMVLASLPCLPSEGRIEPVSYPYFDILRHNSGHCHLFSMEQPTLLDR